VETFRQYLKTIVFHTKVAQVPTPTKDLVVYLRDVIEV